MQRARSFGTAHADGRSVGRGLLGRRRWVLAALLGVGAGGGFALAAAAPASATAPTNIPITVTPSTGLTGGQSVTVSGSGFDKSSIGNILECNDATGQPTVALPAPVGSTVSVSCILIGYAHLVQTDAQGNLNSPFTVIQGTVGPPCGTGGVIATCPADSAGHSAAADAALYPCPPTAAQQAAGAVCQLNYGDAGGASSASATILFAGESAPGTTSPTTAATAPPTTAAPTTAPPTTAAHTTATTSAPTVTTAPTPVTGSSSGTTSAPVSASASGTSSTLASTGPGPDLWVVAVVGFVALYLGAVVLALVDRPRVALYRLLRRPVPGAGPPPVPEFAERVPPLAVSAPMATAPAVPAQPAVAPPRPPERVPLFYPRSSGPPGLWVE